MDTERTFRKLSITKKVALLKSSAEYLGSRRYTAYDIHLYAYAGMLVEVWMKIGLNWVYFVDVQKSKKILELYVEDIDIGRFLD